MSAADSLFRSFGAVELPLSDTGAADFNALNPGRAILLELLAAALVAELTPIWTDAVDSTPLEGTTPVTSKLPDVPDLETVQQVAEFYPLLAVGETGDAQTVDEFTLWQSRITKRWEVDYILGPLEVGNRLKLQDVLGAAQKIIVLTISAGGHRAYQTQTNGNHTFAKQVLGPGDGLAGFSTVRIVEGRIGSASLSENGPKYHALTLILETTELDGPTSGEHAPYMGSTIELKTGTTDGVVPIVNANTSIPFEP